VFIVRGTNISTGRRKNIRVVARSQMKAEAIALEKGVCEPYEIEEFPPDPPTEAQLAYAFDLGLTVPSGATKEDMIYIIRRAVEGDSIPSEDLVTYATSHRFEFSKYIGKRALYKKVFEGLPREECTAFFAFCVYRWLTDDRRGNLDTHPLRNVFVQFSNHYKNDDRFLNSMYNYDGESIRYFGTLILSDGMETQGGSVNTIAYRKTCEFLQEQLGISVRKKTHRFTQNQSYRNSSSTKDTRSWEADTTNIHSSEDATGCSCLVVIIFALIIWFAAC